MIKLENVNYSINGMNILKNINLEIEKGDFIAVVGLNGSGKTQLALLLAGLIDQYQGKYLFEGNELKVSDIVGKKCGIIFQRPDNQFFSSIVKNDIAFGLENLNVPHNEMEAKIDEVLTKFNISELKNRNVNNLSGGEKQMVAIASIVIMNFDFYVFDEITSMLDEKAVKRIFEIVKALHNEGKTIVFITHNLEEIKFANKILILKDGEIVESHNKDTLTNDILTKYELI